MASTKAFPPEAFHAGEVYHLWSYLYETKLYMVTIQIFINHAGEEKVRELLEALLEACYLEEEQQIEAILKESGIRLPPGPPDRPDVHLEDIPAGARLNDDEIMKLTLLQLKKRKFQSTYMISLFKDENISTLFHDFHTQKIEHEKNLIRFMKQYGWLVQPPTNIK